MEAAGNAAAATAAAAAAATAVVVAVSLDAGDVSEAAGQQQHSILSSSYTGS